MHASPELQFGALRDKGLFLAITFLFLFCLYLTYGRRRPVDTRGLPMFPQFSPSMFIAGRAYAFGREMVCSQKSVRNRNFFENATGSAETHTKPCKTSPQGTSIKRPAIYWDHAVSWGGGVWVSVSDIGRDGKK